MRVFDPIWDGEATQADSGIWPDDYAIGISAGRLRMNNVAQAHLRWKASQGQSDVDRVPLGGVSLDGVPEDFFHSDLMVIKHREG